MPELDPTAIGAIGLLIPAVVLLIVVLYLVPVPLWIAAWSSGAYVGLLTLVGMRLRRVPPSTIVTARISAVKAGLQGVSVNDLEAHYLAGGNVVRVVNALISAACSVRSRYGILVEVPSPLDGPNRRLDIDVLVDAENHRLLDVRHRSQKYAAIVLDPHAHFRGRRIQLANTIDRRGVIHPTIDAVFTLGQPIAAFFVEPVPEIVIDAVHSVDVATDTGARGAQSMIFDAGSPAEARQVIERRIARYLFQDSRIARPRNSSLPAWFRPGWK